MCNVQLGAKRTRSSEIYPFVLSSFIFSMFPLVGHLHKSSAHLCLFWRIFFPAYRETHVLSFIIWPLTIITEEGWK